MKWMGRKKARSTPSSYTSDSKTKSRKISFKEIGRLTLRTNSNVTTEMAGRIVLTRMIDFVKERERDVCNQKGLHLF